MFLFSVLLHHYIGTMIQYNDIVAQFMWCRDLSLRDIGLNFLVKLRSQVSSYNNLHLCRLLWLET